MKDFHFSTGRRNNVAGEWVEAHVRFDDHCNNGHQSFAITGDVWSHPTRTGDSSCLACGCVHDEIERTFPELAPFIRWHLTSSDSPMHYAANASYWARKARGLYRVFDHYPYEESDPKAFAAFKSTVVWGAVPDTDTADTWAQLFLEPLPAFIPRGIIYEKWMKDDEAKEQQGAHLDRIVRRFCEGRITRLCAAFERDMQLIQEVAEAAA